jgi:type II secretion system (T2SS) protein F
MTALSWLALAMWAGLQSSRPAATARHRDPRGRRPRPRAQPAVGWLVSRLPRGRVADGPAEARSAAFVLDLLASALTAGAPPELAIEGVVAAVRQHGTDNLRRAVDPLSRVGRLLQLGSEPVAAWATLHSVPGYAPVADCGRRCATSGARLASGLAVVAAELRARHQAEALARAQRVGVWSLLPLGLCFLPAFVCLGVVPVLLGMAGQMLPALAP